MRSAHRARASTRWGLAVTCLGAAVLTTTQTGWSQTTSNVAVPPAVWSSWPPVRNVLFEIRFENYAWGKEINGMYVDRWGGVYDYDRDVVTDPPPTPAPKRRLYTHRPRYLDLDYGRAERVHASGAGHRIGSVDSATLMSMYDQVPLAGAGELIQPGFGCFDAGNVRYVAYYLDARNMHYKAVLLHQAGDMPLRNSAPAAKVLAEWLASLPRGEHVNGGLSFCWSG